MSFLQKLLKAKGPTDSIGQGPRIAKSQQRAPSAGHADADALEAQLEAALAAVDDGKPLSAVAAPRVQPMSYPDGDIPEGDIVILEEEVEELEAELAALMAQEEEPAADDTPTHDPSHSQPTTTATAQATDTTATEPSDTDTTHNDTTTATEASRSDGADVSGSGRHGGTALPSKGPSGESVSGSLSASRRAGGGGGREAAAGVSAGAARQAQQQQRVGSQVEDAGDGEEETQRPVAG